MGCKDCPKKGKIVAATENKPRKYAAIWMTQYGIAYSEGYCNDPAGPQACRRWVALAAMRQTDWPRREVPVVVVLIEEHPIEGFVVRVARDEMELKAAYEGLPTGEKRPQEARDRLQKLE